MDMTGQTEPPRDCRGVSEILGLVGDKWTVQVVVALRDHPRRFNGIKRQVGGISQQMLTRTLKMLVRDGMAERTVSDTTPPQVEYALTALGLSLSEPVENLAHWAQVNLPSILDNRLRNELSNQRGV
jgi:DNA-binding HxlR family transcriptional regulator